MCKYIDLSHVVAGWGCCRCRGYNGLQRTECRGCGQKRHTPLQPDTKTGRVFETYEQAYADEPATLARIHGAMKGANFG